MDCKSKDKQLNSGIEWNNYLKENYDTNNVKWVNKIQEFDVRPYGIYKDFPYDGLSGHELLQNAWLEANGYGARGSDLSKLNPAMALKENPMHKFISSQQRTLKMNTKNLEGVSWRKNVLDNIKLMKQAGVPRDKILELTKATKDFSKNFLE